MTASAALGGAGRDALLAEMAESSSTRSGYKAVRFEEQQRVEAALARSRQEMEIVGAAINNFNKPVVEAGKKVSRRRGKHSRYGVVVSSEDYVKQQATDAAAKKDEAEEASKRIQKAWEKHRKLIRLAEAELKKKGTPSKLKVGQMKDIIRSRTGKGPKNQSNRKRGTAGDGEGAVLKECRASIEARSETLLPPTPSKPGGGSGSGNDDDEESSDDDDDMGVAGAAAGAAIAAAAGDGSDDDESLPDICSKCQTEVATRAKFCPECGTKL